MTKRVLVSAPYMLPVAERHRSRLERSGIDVIAASVRERLEENELLGLVGDIDGMICGDDRLTRVVLEAAAPRLRVISKWGTGIDSIDREAASRLGIRVCNTPAAFTDPVADTVLGYLLAFARRIPWSTDSLRAGRWEKLASFCLAEATLGIIGVGNIGAAVAVRARAFGMRILGTDIKPIPEDVIAGTGLIATTLDDLLRQSDFVSVNCDLNPTSRHLMNAERFALMKPTAILVNTARGPIVDESALVTALRAGRLSGAALDVFAIEPLPSGSPLLRMPNVLLAAHNANSSPQRWERVHENTINNLLAGLGVLAPGA